MSMPYTTIPTKVQLPQNFQCLCILNHCTYVQNNFTLVEMIAYPNKVATQALMHKIYIYFVSLIFVPNVQNNPAHGLNI